MHGLRTPRALARRFLTDTRGLETVEWAIVAGLMVTAVLLIASIGIWVKTQFSALETVLP